VCERFSARGSVEKSGKGEKEKSGTKMWKRNANGFRSTTTLLSKKGAGDGNTEKKGTAWGEQWNIAYEEKPMAGRKLP